MSNVDAVRNELIRLGWTPVQAAGLVGNFQQESGMGLSPTIRGDGGMSHGIAQWNGGRLKNLQSFAQQNGGSWQDPIMQAQFVNHELNTSEKTAGDMLRRATSIEDAAKAGISFERPQGWTTNNPTGGHGWNNRLRNAQSIMGMPVTATNSAVASAPMPAAAPSTGITLNTNPIAAAPVAAPVAPVQTPFQIGQDKGIGAGIKAAMGSDKVGTGLASLAGIFGGGGSGQQASGGGGSDYDITPSSIGADQQQATIAQGAQQLMSTLMAKRKPRGLSLMGMA